jgi:sister chromatid cohesion protein DCC1
MTSQHELSFSARAVSEDGLYKLLELPPDLCSLIESQLQDPPTSSNLSLCVKGGPTDDAVLCTPNQTYAIRSVSLSNSVLVVTAPQDGEHDDESAIDSDAVVIRDQVNEILELTRAVPKLHKLDALLRGSVYNGEDDEDEDEQIDSGMSYETAQEEIQASQGEIDAAMKARKILDLRGRLRPVAPSHLHTILELILTQLASLSLSGNTEALPFKQLSTALDEEHQIPRTVTWQVMEWFGEMVPGANETKWKMDVPAVVKQVGLGVLRPYKVSSGPLPSSCY